MHIMSEQNVSVRHGIQCTISPMTTLLQLDSKHIPFGCMSRAKVNSKVYTHARTGKASVIKAVTDLFVFLFRGCKTLLHLFDSGWF